MSCYAHREDPERFVDIFNRTVAPVVGRGRLSTHLCFGNFQGHAVGPRRYAPMFPAFNAMTVDEIHVEMASRELAELDVVATIAERHDVAVGIIDVKSYFVEPPDADRRAGPPVPRARPAGAVVLRPRLRPVADGPLGRQAEARQPRRRRPPGPRGGRACRDDMIEPVQRDDELLADIAAGQASGDEHLRLWWLGQAGFLVQFDGNHLLLDPYLSDSLTAKYAATDKPHVRLTARAVDPASARHGRRRHVEPQPHRPPRPRDVVAAARRQPGVDTGHPGGQPGVRRRATAHRSGVAASDCRTVRRWRSPGSGSLPSPSPTSSSTRTSSAVTITSATSSAPGRSCCSTPATPCRTRGWPTSCSGSPAAGASTSRCCRSTAACPSAACPATSGVTRRRRSPTRRRPPRRADALRDVRVQHRDPRAVRHHRRTTRPTAPRAALRRAVGHDRNS